MAKPARPDDVLPEFGSVAYLDALRAAARRVGARLDEMSADEFRASLLGLPMYAGPGAATVASGSEGIAAPGASRALGAVNVIAPMERRYAEPMERALARWRAVGAERLGDSMRAFAEALSTPEHTVSAEDLGARLERDPEHRILVEHIHALAADVDDAVVPALRRLATSYVREPRRPDAFFRGLTRVLCDLDAEEFAALGLLLRSALHASDPTIDRIEIHQLGNGAEHDEVGWLEGRGPDAQVRRESIPRIPHLRRLMRLFKSHDLAEESVGGQRDAFSGPDVISIERAMLSLVSLYVNGDAGDTA